MFLRWTIFFFILFAYRAWFFPGTLAGGDWPYLFKETIQGFSFLPDPSNLWLGPYYQITSKIFVEYLHIPWEITERIWWFWMFLTISFFSSLFLSRVILGKTKFNFLSILIFLTNSYILMIVGGGQMGVALAYALAPAVLASSVNCFRKTSFQNLIIAGILLALQVMFDPRIAYIVIIAIALYIFILAVSGKNKRQLFHGFLAFFFVSAVVIFLINSPWIIARFSSGSKFFFVDSSSGSADSLRFFSFGSFSQALSLLHPNWPENIFGKTNFLKPEFLALPLLVFCSLLFFTKSKNFKKELLFFLLLGLSGAFLSKGIQEPFGKLYLWMFFYVPGFSLFRDPTKFYLLIVLSYSILIPFTLKRIGSALFKFNIGTLALIPIVSFILFWAFLVRPLLFDELSGTFKPHEVPQEYVLLKNFLIEDTSEYATLWVPNKSPMSFFSPDHRIFESISLDNSEASSIRRLFETSKTKQFLKKNNIKYVIVPEDTKEKIFLTDGKYDEKLYGETIVSLRKIHYLSHIVSFGKIVVFGVHE